MINICTLFLAVAVHVSHGDDADKPLLAFLEKSTESVLQQASGAIASLSMGNNEIVETIDDALYFRLQTTDVTISNLAKFQLLDVSYDEATGSVRIRLTFPSVQIKGNYLLNGTVLQLVPLYGSGTGFSVQSRDLILTLNGSVPLTENSPQIKNGKVALYDPAYTASFPYLLGGGLVFSMITGKVTPLLGKLVFNAYQSDLISQLQEFFISAYNKELVNYHPE